MAALCAVVFGCAPPVVIYRSPAEALASESGGSLRLQTVTGERYTIHHGSVHNDTLYATRVSAPAGADSTVALPLNEVSSLTRAGSGPTVYSAGLIGLSFGVLGGALLTALLAALLSSM